MAAYALALVMPAAYLLLCLYTSPSVQLTAAAVLSATYALVMTIVLVGTVGTAVLGSITSPNVVFLFTVIIIFIVSGIMHPQVLSSSFSSTSQRKTHFLHQGCRTSPWSALFLSASPISMADGVKKKKTSLLSFLPPKQQQQQTNKNTNKQNKQTSQQTENVLFYCCLSSRSCTASFPECCT